MDLVGSRIADDHGRGEHWARSGRAAQDAMQFVWFSELVNGCSSSLFFCEGLERMDTGLT